MNNQHNYTTPFPNCLHAHSFLICRMWLSPNQMQSTFSLILLWLLLLPLFSGSYAMPQFATSVSVVNTSFIHCNCVLPLLIFLFKALKADVNRTTEKPMQYAFVLFLNIPLRFFPTDVSSTRWSWCTQKNIFFYFSIASLSVVSWGFNFFSIWIISLVNFFNITVLL